MSARRASVRDLGAGELKGRRALVRGPLVYCLETADQDGEDAWDLRVDPSAAWAEAERPDLLGGCVTLEADGHVLRD